MPRKKAQTSVESSQSPALDNPFDHVARKPKLPTAVDLSATPLRSSVRGTEVLSAAQLASTLPASVFNPVDLGPVDVLPANNQMTSLDLDSFTDVVHGVSAGSFSAEMTNEHYHSLSNYISCSGMKHLLRSPAHYLAYRQEEKDEGLPNVGTAAHTAVLEPDRFADEYIVFADRRYGKAWDAFKAANPGKVILSEKEMTGITGMVESLRQYRDFPLWDAIRAAQVEKSIFWTDPETGVQCRIRLDALCPFVAFDYKSIDDARPRSVSMQAARMDYDLQAAMYLEGLRHFTGEDYPFIFIFHELAKPHGIWMYPAGAQMIENGMKKFRMGLQVMRRVLDTGEYPCYQNASTELELPRYALQNNQTASNALLV